MEPQDQLKKLIELQEKQLKQTEKMLDVMSSILKSLPKDNSKQTDAQLKSIKAELKDINENIDRIFLSM